MPISVGNKTLIVGFPSNDFIALEIIKRARRNVPEAAVNLLTLPTSRR